MNYIIIIISMYIISMVGVSRQFVIRNRIVTLGTTRHLSNEQFWSCVAI